MSENSGILDFGFYNLDCMEGMKCFPDQYFDLAIVDPPYGINVGKTAMGAGGGCPTPEPQCSKSARRAEETRRISRSAGRRNKQIQHGGGTGQLAGRNPSEIRVGGGLAVSPKIYKAFDDSHTPDAGYFRELKRVAKNLVIWGGNYFIDNLEPTECFIVWDKDRRGLNFADCELAWTNFKQPCRVFKYKWNGMLQENMKNKEYRIHPTQKPVELYKWILTKFAKPGDKILDTHVGSASSLIACQQLGFQYVGFEINEDYYNLALKRLEQETAQISIFDILRKESENGEKQQDFDGKHGDEHRS